MSTTVKQRVRDTRLERKWTQAQLALAAGVSPSAIGNIEGGTRQSPGTLPVLAIALGVNHAWLAWGEGDKYPAVGVVTSETKKLSTSAFELAQLYDLIPESSKIKRAEAFSAAAAAIIKVLEAAANAAPTPDPKTPKPARLP